MEFHSMDKARSRVPSASSGFGESRDRTRRDSVLRGSPPTDGAQHASEGAAQRTKHMQHRARGAAGTHVISALRVHVGEVRQRSWPTVLSAVI
jgi:hypothetical protein